MNKQHSPLLKKDATQSILASILSIIIGLMVGCIIILIVGLTSDNLTLSSALDGIQLIFGGSGIVPAAIVAIIFNIILPKDAE